MTLILRDATLIDGTAGEPKTKSSIVIEGDTIADITAQPTHRREDAQVYDLSGLTMLPGLIDAHAHLGLVYDFAAEGDPGLVSPAEIAARAFENCNLCLDAGFTTVRDMCGVDGGIVRAIASGQCADHACILQARPLSKPADTVTSRGLSASRIARSQFPG